MDPGQKVKAKGPRSRRASGHVSLRRMSPSLLYRRRCSWVGGGPFPAATGAPSLGWRWTRTGRDAPGLWSHPVPRSCSAHRPQFSPLLLAERPGAAANTAAIGRQEAEALGLEGQHDGRNPGGQTTSRHLAVGHAPACCWRQRHRGSQSGHLGHMWQLPPHLSQTRDKWDSPEELCSLLGAGRRAQTRVGQVPVTGGLCA